MIGIFVLLIIAMLLVTKYCKKTLKIVLGLVIILVTLYCVVLSIDMNRITSLREPIFAKQVNYINGWIDTYDYSGLGYRIEIDKADGQIISVTMYMFDKVIAGVATQITEKVSDFKGLELYVWKNGETMEFGFLSGTNRNKTTEEIEKLKETPKTLEEVIDYINMYDADIYVFFIQVNELYENEISLVKQKIENNTNCELVIMDNEKNAKDNNPIDKFFGQLYDKTRTDTYTNNLISSLYRQAWKEELNNAYDKLYEIAHPDIKEQVLEMKETNNSFAEMSEIFGLQYGFSTAFGEIEEVQGNDIYDYDYPINYSSGVQVLVNDSSSRVYKESTLRVFELLRKTNYIFEEEEYISKLKKENIWLEDI